MSSLDLTALRDARRRTARVVLEMYKRANAGHIGSSLSCLEILLDVFNRAAKDDQLILSKGHAAAALYATLAHADRLDPTLLSTFYKDGTMLAAHPPCGRQLKAIPFGTGSLGHGLSLATGLAFSQRFSARKFHVYAVLSDGDCNEGSTWEAAMFAAHHKLEQLTVIVDRNGLQGFGSTADVFELEPFADKWRSFGFDVALADDGNDFASLDRAHSALGLDQNKGRPRCIVARTTKGHGVSFMENKMEWHYLPMNDEQYATAQSETDLLQGNTDA
jgi:transketolase